MASKDEKSLYDTLAGGTDIPPSEEDFSLEEILAEYGAGREQNLLRDVERAAGEPPAEAPPEKQGPPTEERVAPPPAGQGAGGGTVEEELLQKLRQELPR